MLQALALEFGERGMESSHDGAMADNSSSGVAGADSTFYEITVATVDQPKLLSRLSDAMVSSSWRYENSSRIDCSQTIDRQVLAGWGLRCCITAWQR